MALKAALMALVLLGVWMTLFRPGGGRTGPGTGRARRGPERSPRPQDLEACPRCGVFRPPGGACDCDPRSTSAD